MSILEDLKKDFSLLSKDLDKKKTAKEMLEAEKTELEKEIESFKINELEMRGVILQKMSERQRASACKKLESLGTAALQYAISPNYKMKIDLSSGKRPTADVLICKSNGIEVEPKEGGGGVVDISSMALRIISLESHEPFIDGPIILDEPGKMVSKEYIPMLSEFIKKISNDFDRQVIVITHNDHLAQVADRRIRMSIDEPTNVSYAIVE